MTNKKQGAIALAAVVATILTMAATTAGQASQTVEDRGTRITAPAGATVVAWGPSGGAGGSVVGGGGAGGGVSTQRSGR